MQILDNLIIVGLHIACFWAGICLADRYHRQEKQQVEYEVRLAQARMQAGDYAVYVAPPKKKHYPIGQPFLDRMKENGQAVQQINPDKPIA